MLMHHDWQLRKELPIIVDGIVEFRLRNCKAEDDDLGWPLSFIKTPLKVTMPVLGVGPSIKP